MRFFIPNSITCMALFCGFTSIMLSATAAFESAVVLIYVGVFLDMLDGFAARLLNATSHFGQELDSLADLVVFGVAPSTVLYLRHFAVMGLPGLVIGAVPVVCMALRLAHFNLHPKERAFTGLPSPAAALGLLAGVPCLAGNWLACTAFVAAISLLMLSRMPYPAHMPSLRAGLGLGIAIILTLIWQGVGALVLWSLVYVTAPALYHGLQYLWSLLPPAARPLPGLSNPAVDIHPPVNQSGLT